MPNSSPDTFAGNSGSGVFDENGLMVGILVSGETDYVLNGSCYVVNELADALKASGGTDFLVDHLMSSVGGLRLSGWIPPRIIVNNSVGSS